MFAGFANEKCGGLAGDCGRGSGNPSRWSKLSAASRELRVSLTALLGMCGWGGRNMPGYRRIFGELPLWSGATKNADMDGRRLGESTPSISGLADHWSGPDAFLQDLCRCSLWRVKIIAFNFNLSKNFRRYDMHLLMGELRRAGMFQPKITRTGMSRSFSNAMVSKFSREQTVRGAAETATGNLAAHFLPWFLQLDEPEIRRAAKNIGSASAWQGIFPIWLQLQPQHAHTARGTAAAGTLLPRFDATKTTRGFYALVRRERAHHSLLVERADPHLLRAGCSSACTCGSQISSTLLWARTRPRKKRWCDRLIPNIGQCM